MKRFGIIGVAGYIAIKHINAIKKTGNILQQQLTLMITLVI